MDIVTPWRITLLGSLCVVRGADVVTRFRSQKAGGLLAYLALFPRRVHAREELADLFWPDADSEAGRTNLRSILASLRRQLEPPGVEAGSVLVTRGHNDVFLNLAAVETDVAAFERTLASAAAASQDKERLRLLSEAVGLYGGPLLPGRYEDWVLTERDRLAEMYVGALRDLTNFHEAAGNRPLALESARRAISADPLCEEAHLSVLRLLMSSGQVAAAKRHYQELERLFGEQLGVAPPDEAQALLRTAPGSRVLPQALTPRATPLVPASKVFPAVSVSVSPSPTTPAPPPVFLPLTLTHFFGRDREEAQIAAALRGREGVRLLTLTGAGGSGKTRLAIETARTLTGDFPGGVWFVPLAELSDAERFFDAVAAVLRLPQTTAVSARAQVIEYLQQRGEVGRTLLVLDNFEQIVDGAAGGVARLLAETATLSCLVTSRQKLLLDGEYEMPLSPLPTPDFAATLAGLPAYPSVQLFVARAQAARPDFQLTERNAVAVAQLCRHLEGIPLALELAAAWAQTLSPAQMLERLARRFDLLVSRRRDVAGRHATLRATVEWSYQLLTPELRRFFAGLSVFHGGWTLEAAEDVLDEPHALEYMAELQDRSLILPLSEIGGESRFGVLETLREFAAEQVSAEEQERLAGLHLRYFRRLAAETEPLLRGPQQTISLRRLEAEGGNLRAALRAGLFSADPDRRNEGLRLAATLAWFFIRQSRFRAGREWLDAARSVDGDPAARIRVLQGRGLIAYFQAEDAAALGFFEESRALAESLGREDDVVLSLFGLAITGLNDADPSTLGSVAATARECLARAEAWGEPRLIADALIALSLVTQVGGDFAAASAQIARGLALYRELGDVWNVANCLNAQGLVQRLAGEHEAAAVSLREVVSLAREMENGQGLVWSLLGLAGVAARRGEPERAARLFGAAEQLAHSVHTILPGVLQMLRAADIDAARAALADDGRFDTAWAEGRAMTLPQAITLALK